MNAIDQARWASEHYHPGCLLCQDRAGCRPRTGFAGCRVSAAARALDCSPSWPAVQARIDELLTELMVTRAVGFAGTVRGVYGGPGSLRRLVGERWVSPAEQRAEAERAIGALLYLRSELEGVSPRSVSDDR